MAIIPKFFFDAVVAIGVNEKNDTKWIGTGFLVGRKDFVSDAYTIYLITNYHIVENKCEIVVRFNKKDIFDYRDYGIKLIDGEVMNFSKHDNADIIAIQISPNVLNNDNSEYNWFSLDKHALTINQMEETDVIEGCLVYSLGFPINMIGENRKTPICRLGCISRVSDLFSNRNNEYLIDLQAILGNSGAPVINRPEDTYIQGTAHNTSSNLIGIISGTIDYSEQCEDDKCTKEHERNSGIATVHTVDAIMEVVEKEYNRGSDQN